MREVIALSMDHIRAGPMTGLFSGHVYPEGTVIELPTEVAAQFIALQQMLTGYGLDPEA